jgi:phosphoribosyl-ATP pyrophosphohydrolase
MDEGLPKVAQKVGEEAVETVIAALAEDQDALLNESADLLYHLLVLLAVKDVRLQQVIAILKQR